MSANGMVKKFKPNNAASGLVQQMKRMKVGECIGHSTSSSSPYAVAINGWEGRKIFRTLKNAKGDMCLVRVAE